MDWKKIAPWNWFKTEDEALPVAPRVGLSGLLRPSLDISESEKHYTVRVELPGVEPDQVRVDVANRNLAIRAEKRQEREEEDEGYHCVERSYGSVQRVLSLPDDADEDGAVARFRNGVLTLRIPRHISHAPHSRSIEIQTA